MENRNLFWGLVIKPGKRYETEVQEAFRVTKVRSGQCGKIWQLPRIFISRLALSPVAARRGR